MYVLHARRNKIRSALSFPSIVRAAGRRVPGSDFTRGVNTIDRMYTRGRIRYGRGTDGGLARTIGIIGGQVRVRDGDEDRRGERKIGGGRAETSGEEGTSEQPAVRRYRVT